MENKYIGDEKMTKMLKHYNCETPLEVIKMRFAGAICSPNLDLRPSDVISSFWPQGESPRLQTKDEADLFFKFFMGLWDEVFANVQANKIKLEKLTFKDVAYYCERRYAEIELGFIEGFWGGKEDAKIPTLIAELIDQISVLAETYQRIGQKFSQGAKEENVVETIKSCDDMVNNSIIFLIEKFVLPRIEEVRRTVN